MPSSVTITPSINPGAFAQLRANAGMQWGNRVGRAVVNAMADRCPVDEARLRSSLTHTVSLTSTGVELRIGSPLDYAVYVVKGTGIYGPRQAPIYPVRAQALKFPTPRVKGPLRVGEKHPTGKKRGFVFAKHVKGRPPNLFMIAGFEAVLGPGKVRVNG